MADFPAADDTKVLLRTEPIGVGFTPYNVILQGKSHETGYQRAAPLCALGKDLAEKP
jgi:hypothetical protein